MHELVSADNTHTLLVAQTAAVPCCAKQARIRAADHSQPHPNEIFADISTTQQLHDSTQEMVAQEETTFDNSGEPQQPRSPAPVRVRFDDTHAKLARRNSDPIGESDGRASLLRDLHRRHTLTQSSADLLEQIALDTRQVYVYAFRGVRHVNGVRVRDLPPEMQEEIRQVQLKFPLLYTGEFQISLLVLRVRTVIDVLFFGLRAARGEELSVYRVRSAPTSRIDIASRDRPVHVPTLPFVHPLSKNEV